MNGQKQQLQINAKFPRWVNSPVFVNTFATSATYDDDITFLKAAYILSASGMFGLAV